MKNRINKFLMTGEGIVFFLSILLIALLAYWMMPIVIGSTLDCGSTVEVAQISPQTKVREKSASNIDEAFIIEVDWETYHSQEYQQKLMNQSYWVGELEKDNSYRLEYLALLESEYFYIYTYKDIKIDKHNYLLVCTVKDVQVENSTVVATVGKESSIITLFAMIFVGLLFVSALLMVTSK